jgi:pimeloyl-ACP methyl ester carboxylesterase
MTAVFVHGNPETAAVWSRLLAELGDRPVECLSPPGFGSPLPAGFGATATEYRDWLIAELEKFPEPVDLVGHDWGGAHVVNAVMARPELVRSWASDCAGAFDPDYEWHELAQVWQKPGVGEEAVAAMFGAPVEARAQRLVGAGMHESVAGALAAGMDESMARAVLPLYRSAAQPALKEFSRNLERAAESPGLVLLATEDHMVGTDEQRHRAAARAGARVAVLEGLGHWWMTQDPVQGARVLTEFWDSVGG